MQQSASSGTAPISSILFHHEASCVPSARAAGLLTMIITESPLRNILLTYRSLLIAAPVFFPFPPLDVSVHISLTSSKSLNRGQNQIGKDWGNERSESGTSGWSVNQANKKGVMFRIATAARRHHFPLTNSCDDHTPSLDLITCDYFGHLPTLECSLAPPCTVH